MIVDTGEAQEAFECLPGIRRIPSLSPAYAMVDCIGKPEGTTIHMLRRDACGVLIKSVHETPLRYGEGSDWEAPYNYGGQIWSGNPDPLRWAAFDRVALDRGVIAEFRRSHPLGGPAPEETSASFSSSRQCVVVPLVQRDPDELLTPNARTMIRKARRSGVRTVWGGMGDSDFPHRYRRAMEILAAAPQYYFSDQYFRALADLGCVSYAEAQIDGVPVGSAIFLLGPAVAEYHLSELDSEGRKTGAMYLLLRDFIQAARARGARLAFLGGGTNSDLRNPLFRFKQNFSPHTATYRVSGHVFDQSSYRAQPPVASSAGRFIHYRE